MKRILVVDDEKDIRSMLRIPLGRAGYEIEEASDGAMAIAIHRRRPVHLLVLDILMPEKEGIETILEFRRDYPGVKIVAISGGGIVDAGDYLEIAKNSGADRIFKKPLDLPLLITAIKELIGS
ncbi:MAG: response regulator [Candidatus Omnitrophota bacterium]